MRVTSRGRKTVVALAAATLSVSGLAACGGGSGSGGNSSTVTIWSSIDQPVQDGLEKELVAELKAKNSDVKIKWQKVENINQLIITKIQAGDTPDIAFVPQPGVVQQMKDLGAVKPLDDVISGETDSYLPGAADFSKFDGKTYGLLVSMNIKGLVFYNKPYFTSKGYQAPTDLDGLTTLANQIKAGGVAPWCFGIESDTATGWPATDWVENLVLRQSGPDVYKSWVSGKTNFASDDIKSAFDSFEKLVLADGQTYGGRKAIVSTNFATTGNPLVASPPKCGMWEQGSFAPSFLPKNVQSNLASTIGVFGLPPASAGENPYELGGDSITMLNDSDNVKSVVKLLAGTDIGKQAASSSSFISPHKDFDINNYSDDLTKQMVGLVSKATTTVFDGSDQMPAAVGSGTFWKDVTAWISGEEDLDTALKNIDESFPSS